MDILRVTRRHILTALGALISTTGRAMTHESSRLTLLLAPTNLGLRPTPSGALRAWLHLDLDVLDQLVMPAVDSPGSPGLSFAQLGQLLRLLVQPGLFIGADVAIYDPDPDLDPSRRYAPRIVETLAQGFAPAGFAKVA